MKENFFNYLSLTISSVIGLMTIIVGFVSIFVMKEQNNLNQKLSLPIFTINKELKYSDGNNNIDSEIITIYNDGYKVKYIYGVGMKTFIEFNATYKDPYKLKNITFPIINFYSIRFKDNNKSGKIWTAYTNGNIQKFTDLQSSFFKINDGVFYEISYHSLISISYMDINGNRKIEYFKDSEPIEKFEYNEILKNFKNAEFKILDILNIEVSDILKLIE